MSKKSPLAEFLRLRRAQLQPSQVGLTASGPRRVAGLRREEVAQLAGISVEYYLRIEQGREHSPSDQVLNGIARALRLDGETAEYLRSLTRNESHRRKPPRQELNPALGALIHNWPLAPTQIHDHTLTVVLANPVALALSPHFAPGNNALRTLFLEPEMQGYYRNWDRLTGWAVRWVRAYAGRQRDPAVDALIDELLRTSQRFRELWSRHHVGHDMSGKSLVTHPSVGDLDLNFQLMTLQRSGHIVTTYWADPHSRSEQKLRALSSGTHDREI